MSQSSNIGFLNIAMSSLHSNGLHIQQVEQEIHIMDVLCDVIKEQRTKAALKVKRVSTLHIFFNVWLFLCLHHSGGYLTSSSCSNILKSCSRKFQKEWAWGLPPEALLKGLLGERATGCWEAELELELELNGLGKSETHGLGGERQGDNSEFCPGVNGLHSCLFKATLRWFSQSNLECWTVFEEEGTECK